MKWGVRRYQKKNGSLTPAGKKRSNPVKEKWNGLTDKQRTAVKLGAAAVGTALAIYGTAKVASYVGRRSADNYFIKNGGNHRFGSYGATLANRAGVLTRATEHGSKVTNTISAIGSAAALAGLAAYGTVEVANLMKKKKNTSDQ